MQKFENDERIMNLGNFVISYELAKKVINDPANEDKVFAEFPCFHPTKGMAFLVKSLIPLPKFHSRLDPFKFLYFGKGVNKEFSVLKRYYHLKHSRLDIDKTLHNFQRHIYCGIEEERDLYNPTIYLVHYFGEDELLQSAHLKKRGCSRPNATIMVNTNLNSFAESPTLPSETDDPYIPLPTGQAALEADLEELEYSPSLALNPPKRKKFQGRSDETVQGGDNSPSHTSTNSPDYVYALSIASQLQQLPDELKVRVKFQIATVFYEAEMEALNGSSNLVNGD